MARPTSRHCDTHTLRPIVVTFNPDDFVLGGPKRFCSTTMPSQKTRRRHGKELGIVNIPCYMLLTDVINQSGGQCWVTSKSNPVPGVQENVPSSRGYEGGFRIELCAKVLGMGSRLAETVGARTILDRPTLDAFGEAIADERYQGKDARVVYKWLNESERK